MTTTSTGRTVVIVDVDGVLSPVHPTGPTWEDEESAGYLFGPVLVSPTLSRRLEDLHQRDGVECCWLTSWTAEMRADMTGFPGRRPNREWRAVVDGVPVNVSDDSEPEGAGWWKLDALLEWLRANPDITAIAWLDDHLNAQGEFDGFREGRLDVVRAALAEAGITHTHLVCTSTEVGLTPADMDELEQWVTRLHPVTETAAGIKAAVHANMTVKD